MIDPHLLATSEFTDGSTIRPISTTNIDEPAMAPLADDEDELAILIELEGMTLAK